VSAALRERDSIAAEKQELLRQVARKQQQCLVLKQRLQEATAGRVMAEQVRQWVWRLPDVPLAVCTDCMVLSLDARPVQHHVCWHLMCVCAGGTTSWHLCWKCPPMRPSSHLLLHVHTGHCSSPAGRN
jgi:hypothetical protein